MTLLPILVVGGKVMFMEITLNNLFVLGIYASAGLLVLYANRSSLAPFAPWAVFAVHLGQVALHLPGDFRDLGILPCLAQVLPHAWIELTGFALGCWVGNRLCQGQRPLRQLALAVVIIILAAFTETYITPFPLGHWLSM